MLAKRRWRGEDVLALRKQYKLTQRQLADMLGVAQPRISEWESGRSNPSKLASVALEKVVELLESKTLN